MMGLHRGHLRGPGLEFSQYRNYEQGDDPRRIDWRLFARSDRYFVRESHRESQLEVWLLVDLSASMAQPSEDIPGWTRLDYARALGASLAWMTQSQGDACGLIGLSDSGLVYRPARRGTGHLDELCLALTGLRAGGAWPAEHRLEALWDQLQRPGMVVLISDFFEREGEVTGLAAKLAAAGKDVLVLQLLTEAERSFPYRGSITFRDRETGKEVEVDASVYAARYLQRFRSSQDMLRSKLAARGLELETLCIEEPLDEALYRFLWLRQRRVQ